MGDMDDNDEFEPTVGDILHVEGEAGLLARVKQSIDDLNAKCAPYGGLPETWPEDGGVGPCLLPNLIAVAPV